MPPHCDTLDGPVVTAARQALELGDVTAVLPYVQHAAEAEVRADFDRARRVRDASPEARELAEQWFFENVVRLHRAGEGEPYTGLKPAGLDEGPVIPVAERALETGDPDELVELLQREIAEEVRARLAHVLEARADTNGDVEPNRVYVEAMLGLEVWVNDVHEMVRGVPSPHHYGHR